MTFFEPSSPGSSSAMSDPEKRMESPRSWLFAPGHDERILGKVFDAGADMVLLDLEDAVPPELKDRARGLVAEAAANRPCWVRVNKPRSDLCERDLEAVAGVAVGLRLPKVESASDVAWVAERAPAALLDCSIESARGVLAAFEIASSAACNSLAYGGVDLALDLHASSGELESLFARSFMVLASRAAGKPPPSDGVHTLINDDEGLKKEAIAARQLGFFGKSAIHPRQVPIINAAFTPTAEEIVWAEGVLAAFELAGGAATKLQDGEFVDIAVAERARHILGRH
jgi:citrate lyase subunit beta / citryl-CoA lyase